MAKKRKRTALTKRQINMIRACIRLAILLGVVISILVVFVKTVRDVHDAVGNSDVVEASASSLDGDNPLNGNISASTNTEIPDSLMDLYEKNEEARDFVMAYAGDGDPDAEIDISADIVEGEIPEFLQWDKRWGYIVYDDDYLAVNGCGPTCLSMVYTGLTGDTKYNPYKMASLAQNMGCKTKGGGTDWSAMTKLPPKLGIRSKEVVFDKEHITRELNMGHPIICNVKEGDFTSGGHYIVLCSVDSNGKVTIHDPNSKINSEKTWDLERIMGQTKNMWSFWK